MSKRSKPDESASATQMMSQAQVPQVDGFFFLRLVGAWRCVVVGRVEFRSERSCIYIPFLVEQGLRLLHRGRVGVINFPSSFAVSWNDPFVLSPPFVALLA